MKRILATATLILFSCTTTAEQQIYCPQNAGYITVGMTEEQVIAACGQPLSKQKSNSPIMEKVPVLQMIYNNQGAPKAFYGVWALPGGNSTPGLPPFGGNSGGARLEIDVIDNKITGVKLNGSDTNAFSICNGVSVQIGDPVSKATFACGSPSLTNNTYINRPIVGKEKPEIWVYQSGQYQQPFTLTFIDGKLQSIN